MTGTIKRRQVLQGVAAVLTTASCGGMPAREKTPKETKGEITMDTSYTPRETGIATGKGAGDFDFLAGDWHIRHKRLKAGTNDDWQLFDSSASVHRVLGGLGSIEELRNADGSYMGMGVRVWLPESGQWADHWTSANNGVVNAPQLGRFIDGDGVFLSEEEVNGIHWKYRGVWDQITSNSCRWHQSASKDGGNSWKWNWWMQWSRQGMQGHNI